MPAFILSSYTEEGVLNELYKNPKILDGNSEPEDSAEYTGSTKLTA